MDGHRPGELSPREQLHVTAERMRSAGLIPCSAQQEADIRALGEPAHIGVDLASGPDETYCFASHPDGTFTDLQAVTQEARALADRVTGILAEPTLRRTVVPIVYRPVHAMRRLLQEHAPWHLPELAKHERELGTLTKRELSDKYWHLKRLFDEAAQADKAAAA